MRFNTLLTFLACTLILAGCSNGGSKIANTNAAIMFVNACANGNKPLDLDGRVNNVIIDGAQSLHLLQNSGYCQVPAAVNSDISFTISGGSTLCAGTASTSVGGYYSVFAYGPASVPQIVVIADDLYKPPHNKARVRFLNFSAGNPRLDCYFGSLLVASHISYYNIEYPGYLGAPAFQDVDPGTATLLMKDPSNPAYAAKIDNQAFDANGIYTVMFTDTSAASAPSGFKVTVIKNY